ncbi:MAG TPA: alpha/beta hydrolase [Blastocatellia bacterium]|nr:alpha/beta hydrolase [Blastocatellia bacterium]
MSNLVRLFVVLALLGGCASVANAQEGATRAEFECLALANSSNKAAPGEKSPFDSFHHVWTPGLRYGSFLSKGVRLAYEMEGDGPETVIVVHGGPGLPHDFYHPVLSQLSRYLTIVYFDRRADMLSFTASGPASLGEMAEDVEALRESLHLDRVTLLGHSFGGAVALTYGLRHPERVKRLILVGTSATIENPADVEKRIAKSLAPNESMTYYSSEGSSGVVTPCDRVRRRYRLLAPRYFHRPPDGQTLDRSVYEMYFDALARKQVLANEAGGFDVRARLGEIKAPTLVIGGRYDLVTPLDQASELAGGLPLSRLVVMEHSGHFPFIEEGYVFTEWVRRFINATPGGSSDTLMSSEVTASKGPAN